MFRRGVALMDDQQYEQACAAFEGTMDLEAGLGTMLRLADCYDQLGRTASAWALFRDAQSLATKLEDDLREQIATARARELGARLSLVRLEVPDGTNIQELTLAGARIPRAMWHASVPVDPGSHAVTATAPGYRSWESRVEVPEGPHSQRLSIPTLTPLASTPAKGSAIGANSDNAERSRRAEEHASLPTAGTIAVVVGAVGLVAAGYLSYRAYSTNDQSLRYCRADDHRSCLQRGIDLREDAQAYAAAATMVTAGSAAVLLTGLGIWWWAPEERGADGVGAAGVTYSGAW